MEKYGPRRRSVGWARPARRRPRRRRAIPGERIGGLSELAWGGDEPAHAEHRGVAEAHLAQVPAQPVPGERRGDPEERERDQVVHVRRRVQQRHQRQENAGDDQRDQGARRHPSGRRTFIRAPLSEEAARPDDEDEHQQDESDGGGRGRRGATRMAKTSTRASIRAAIAGPARCRGRPAPPPRTTSAARPSQRSG